MAEDLIQRAARMIRNFAEETCDRVAEGGQECVRRYDEDKCVTESTCRCRALAVDLFALAPIADDGDAMTDDELRAWEAARAQGLSGPAAWAKVHERVGPARRQPPWSPDYDRSFEKKVVVGCLIGVAAASFGGLVAGILATYR